MDAAGAQHRGELARTEPAADRRIAHVEAAGVGAEGRQDHPLAVGDEAAPPRRRSATRAQGCRWPATSPRAGPSAGSWTRMRPSSARVSQQLAGDAFRALAGRGCRRSRPGCGRGPGRRCAVAAAGASRRLAPPSWKVSPRKTITRGDSAATSAARRERVSRCRRAAASGRGRRRPSPSRGAGRRRPGRPAPRATGPRLVGGHRNACRRQSESRPRRRRSRDGLGDQVASAARPGSSRARRPARAAGRSPGSPAPRTATGASSAPWRMRPLMRASISPRRATSTRPCAASLARAAQQQMVRLVAAQHVVDEVGGEADLAPALLRRRGSAARSGRRSARRP